jgi:hypothetical protein
LVEVFPTGRGERSSEERNAEFLCLLRSSRKAIIKTRLAALPALRFVLQTLHGREPFFMAIPAWPAVSGDSPVVIYPLYAERLRMPFGLVLADLVFLERVDVRIEIVYDGRDIMRQQPLYDG